VGKDQRLCESGLAFFGRITASVSHDINNVLSTMGEFSGLLQDFIEAGQQKGDIPPERLQRLADGLAAQVQKGAAIVKRLNRFAHTTDEPRKSIELSEFLELIMALSQRFAGLKQVTLKAAFAAEPITIQTSPFMLQQVVFHCIDLALVTADRNHPVTVSTSAEEQGAGITVAFRPIQQPAADDERITLIRELAEELGGTVSAGPADSNLYLVDLRLPTSLPV
jgi:C4-dicarboxylate-specific signal transduction histidine kinase